MQCGLRGEGVAQRFPFERRPEIPLRFKKTNRGLVTTRFYSQNFHIQEFRLPRRQLCCPSGSQEVSIPKILICMEVYMKCVCHLLPASLGNERTRSFLSLSSADKRRAPEISGLQVRSNFSIVERLRSASSSSSGRCMTREWNEKPARVS